jgi:glycosyltransferase involved in cell wall biosynthesis
LCKKHANSRTIFITNGVSEDDLIPVYQNARVHVLASWFETPGLVSLEAALAGCAVVTTDRGSPREYFGDLARYCRPDSIGSIRCAVEQAWEEGPTPGLREHVLNNFTWETVAKRTLDAYQLALSQAKP